MTTEELNTIVQAVIDKINEQALDFDVLQTAPESTDLLTAVRPGTNGTYQGVALKWDDVAATVTQKAKDYRDEAQTAQQEAETAKSGANAILAQVQSKGTEITNFVATSKTEIETQKNESVNAVKSVYQTDLNEVQNDLNAVQEAFNTRLVNIKLSLTDEGLLHIEEVSA